MIRRRRCGVGRLSLLPTSSDGSQERPATALSCFCVHFLSLSLFARVCCCVYVACVSGRRTEKNKRMYYRWRCPFRAVFFFCCATIVSKKRSRALRSCSCCPRRKKQCRSGCRLCPSRCFSLPRNLLGSIFSSISADRLGIVRYFDPPPPHWSVQRAPFSIANGARKLRHQQQRKRASTRLCDRPRNQASAAQSKARAQPEPVPLLFPTPPIYLSAPLDSVLCLQTRLEDQ